MVATAAAPEFDFGRVGVDILALAAFEFADQALLIEALHFLIEDHVGVVFCEHVDLAALFHRPRQRHAFTQRMAGGGFAHHVFVGLQCLDGKGGVLVEVVGEDDCVHVVGEEFVVVEIGGYAEGVGLFGQALAPGVAQRDQFHAGGGSAADEGATATNADDADADGLCGHCSDLGLLAGDIADAAADGVG